MAASPPRNLTLRIRGPLARADLPGLFERTCALLDRTTSEVLLCRVDGVAADAVAVDALARLALAARRRGCYVRLRGASAELRGLVEFMGLTDVLRG
jgi:ABC-type transporter Mla MlaB component